MKDMKKFFLFVALLAATLGAGAQNLQLHYDLGRNIYPNEEGDRQKVTLTLEQFKADQWGSWYYFADIDFSRHNTTGAYAEISREFNLGKQSPFAAHVEWDAGLNLGGSFQHSALIGPAWNGHSQDFSKTYSLQLLYKQFFKSGEGTHPYASLQLTGVWSTTFAHRACTFAGFFDFWRGEKANHHGQLIFMSEPQLWYNFDSIKGWENTHLSIGTEVELSSNFIYNTYSSKSFFVNPTLGVKWTF